MLPGSKHPDGGTYRSKDFRAPIAELPADLIEAIRKRRQMSKASAGNESMGTIRRGQRNNRLTSIAGAVRRQGYDENVILSVLKAVNDDCCSFTTPERKR